MKTRPVERTTRRGEGHTHTHTHGYEMHTHGPAQFGDEPPPPPVEPPPPPPPPPPIEPPAPPAVDVPAAWRPLYDELQTSLDAFQVAPSIGSANTPPLLGAALTPANSNQGRLLLQPGNIDMVTRYLDRFNNDLNLRLVQLDIQFPMFCAAYHNTYGTAGELLRYRDYYMEVVDEIRTRGFKLAIENQVTFPASSYGNLPGVEQFYAGLSWEAYKAGRAETLAYLAANFQPDYLTGATERDTERMATGRTELRTLSRYFELLTALLAIPNLANTKLGMGLGTWDGDRVQLAEWCAQRANFVNLHIYAVVGNELEHAEEIAKIARAHNKPLAIGEIGLYKVTAEETGQGIGSSIPLYSRDAWAFWTPLDIKFVQTAWAIAKTSLPGGYMSYFWSHHFNANLPYVGNEETGQPLMTKHQQAANAALRDGLPLTALGEAYRGLAT